MQNEPLEPTEVVETIILLPEEEELPERKWKIVDKVAFEEVLGLRELIKILNEAKINLRLKFTNGQIARKEGSPWAMDGLDYLAKEKWLNNQILSAKKDMKMWADKAFKRIMRRKTGINRKTGRWMDYGNNPDLAVHLRKQGYEVRVVEVGKVKRVEVLQ